MSGFEVYVKDILNERGINEHDKKDLAFEIEDHLMLLKNEYLDKGLSENEAIKLSIKDFGESNSIGNSIKNNLPSHNKYLDFTFKEKVQCLSEMFLIYFFILVSCATFLNVNIYTIFFYVSMDLVVILTSFIFVNRKVNNVKNKVKNIIHINIQFFIIEKIVMSLFFIISLPIRGGTNILETKLPLMNFYIFNWIYIIGFILLTLISLIITKYVMNKVTHNIKNNYNNTITSTILFITSILFIILYILIPNRFYVLRKILISIMGSDITEVSRNALFMVINNNFIIPNIGLVILIILCIRLVIHIKKKGIGSIL
ncbi:permease prefix domain 1-containing protein [Clostridium estertheticum]|uniref:permease prefix domain 1-containing protein n=1 Tax=Clostridium estertheticum TaxID=238834 RepID=UPI001CF28157|nr:permease prefix domain 1-containing protein [Clostridium estertheticum]MCB2342500.1 permease prefix domain 1-containing protein [Clostridium estertheticum]